MRLYLLRHGETDWNAERRTQGQSDVELNDTGRHQALEMAQALKSAPLAAIYSSPLKRAYLTATVIAAEHGLPVQVLPGLMELNQGELDGLLPEEMRQRHDHILRRWNAGATSLKLPGGESMDELQKRGWDAIQEIYGQHPADEVAVVGHNLANLSIMCAAIGLPLAVFQRLHQDTGSLSVIEINGGRNTLLRFNDVSFSQHSNRA